MDEQREECSPGGMPTLGEIKKCLPKTCFEPVLSVSCYYLVRDIVIFLALYLCMRSCEWLVLFPLYWLVSGTVLWGLFVVGHDCGHGSFSRQPWYLQLLLDGRCPYN